MTSPARPRFPWIAFALSLVPYAFLVSLYVGFRVDDAYIALRYADHLSRGLGLTFNPGERVEGVTSVALPVFEALIQILGGNGLVAVKWLGFVSGLVVIAATMAITLRLSRSIAATRFAGALIAFQPALAVCAMNGLETVPFAACVTVSLLWFLNERLASAGALLAVAALIRPEGALILVLFAVSLVLQDRRKLARLVVPFAGLALPLLLWKALYFGTIIPNTAVAKVPANLGLRLGSGVHYLLELSSSHWDLVAWLCLAGLAVARVEGFRTLLWIALAWLGYVADTGGDWIPHARFLLPVLPIAAISLSVALYRLWLLLGDQAPIRRVWIPYVLMAIGLLPTVRRDGVAIVDGAEALSEATLHEAIPLGAWLRKAAPPSATAALLDVGAVGYESDLKLIDAGGLTDRVIARVIHDGGGHYVSHLYMPDQAASAAIADETFNRHPEFIVVMLSGAYPSVAAHSKGSIPAAYPQDAATVNDPRLAQQFRYVCHLPGTAELDGSSWSYNVFARQDIALRAEPVVTAGDRLCE